MKKIALLILMIVLASCTTKNPTPIQTTTNTTETGITHMNVVEFGYNNHDYIMFTHYLRCDISGITHSPDCHCFKNFKRYSEE